MPAHSRVAAIFAAVLVLTLPVAAQKRRAVAPPQPSILYSEGGYASQTSVLQGRSIDLHIATAITPFSVDIVNLLQPQQVLASIPGMRSSRADCTNHYGDGCRWPTTTTITIPMSWRSGYYAARFPTSSGVRYAPFVVRSANPGSVSPILVISSTNTFQAYNEFGGNSVQQSEAHGRSDVVSFNRPYDTGAGLGGYTAWEDDFALWMTQQQIAFEVATDQDLEDPTLLSRYNEVVFVGHSEYWTAAARHNLEEFSSKGGHIAIFGGNTMWWQARTPDDGRSLLVYKDASRDPETGHHNDQVTVNWFADPVYRPENLLIGASFRNGGFANRAGDPSTWSDDPKTFQFKPVQERSGFTTVAADSWVFSGTGLHTGQSFGQTAAGLEVDGVIFNCDSQGLPAAAEGSDGTPLNYHVLAYTPASQGYGTIGYYVNPSGGAVFNAATQEWASALFVDQAIAQITRNVLERFATGALLPYDPAPVNVRMMDLFNCAQSSPASLAWWEGDAGSAKISSRCAYEGPSGLELSGPKQVAVARNFSPEGVGLAHAEVRFYLNADSFRTAPEWPVPLVTLRADRNGGYANYASVELYVINGQRAVRLALPGADGQNAATTQWVVLPSGWQSIQMGWRSPGAATLQVGSGNIVTVNNPMAGESAAELELYYPAASASDYVCIDALAAGPEPIAPTAGLR